MGGRKEMEAMSGSSKWKSSFRIDPKDVADSKISQAIVLARRHEYPLICSREVAYE